MRAHLLHGFNVKDRGRASTDTLKPYLYAAGYEVLDHDYGWLGLLGVRLFNGHIAARVARAVVVGDIGIGHSNGCAILLRAAHAGARFRGLVFINPALDRDADLPGHITFAHVYYNAGDDAVRLGGLLAGHEWGDMGAVGYCGTDPRWRNIDCSRWLSGHSALFAAAGVWGPRIVNTLDAETAL